MSLQASDLAKYGPKNNIKIDPIIERANTVDIREVYKKTGLWAPDGEYYSWKIVCPFGAEHSDGGVGKNCRVYPPTSIMCFEMHGYISPVRLYARLNNLSYKTAAKRMLEEFGLIKYKSYRQRWLDLQKEQETPQLGPQSYAVDALQKELYKDPLYANHEYDAQVRAEWERVLEVLDAIWTFPDTDVTILKIWLDKSATRIRMAYSD